MKMFSGLVMVGVSVLFAGCGSDSSDSGTGNDATTLARIIGPVESISYDDETLSVNGHQLDGSAATVSYDDNTFSFNDLAQGMVVEAIVSGTQAQRVSQQITLQPVLSGPVTAVSADSITVNGVVVATSGSGFAVGDWVLVFAMLQPDDSWQVLHVAKTPSLTSAELEGGISQLDTAGSTFLLQTVKVDFSNAVIDDSRPLLDGAWAEVHGQFSGDTFVASRIEVKQGRDVSGSEFEGIVTWVSDDGTEFEVGGYLRVKVDGSTVFDDGSPADLKPGAIVELDLVELNGQLVATKVDFESQASGSSPSVPTSTSFEFKVEGEASFAGNQLTINQIPFIVDANTEFVDGLSLSSINGMWVEIQGRSLNGEHRAKKIDQESKDSEISLEGVVSSGSLWGYSATDGTLDSFEGKWADVECRRSESNELSQCRNEP